jgi:hypothetical protein
MKREASDHAGSAQALGDPAILSVIREKLESIERRLATKSAPETWSVDDISLWLGLSKFTTNQRVVTRPGFPKPIVPVGTEGAQKRWFADEVIEWFRQNRGAMPKPRSGRPRGRPRSDGKTAIDELK